MYIPSFELCTCTGLTTDPTTLLQINYLRLTPVDTKIPEKSGSHPNCRKTLELDIVFLREAFPSVYGLFRQHSRFMLIGWSIFGQNTTKILTTLLRDQYKSSASKLVFGYRTDASSYRPTLAEFCLRESHGPTVRFIVRSLMLSDSASQGCIQQKSTVGGAGTGCRKPGWGGAPWRNKMGVALIAVR